MTLIGIQRRYIDTINAGLARWEHSRAFGHMPRINRGARKAAEKALRKIGYTDQAQIDQIIRDAADVAALERNAAE